VTPEDADALRCAVHPSLPSYDTCPVCARPRCAGDAGTAPGGGCYACQGVRKRKGPPPLDLRAVVGAGVACGLVTPIAGLVSSEYIGAPYIEWIVPFFVGIVLGIAAEAGARKSRGRALRLMAMAYAVLAVATGLDYPLAAASAFSPVLHVLKLYVIAAGGAYVWTMPPKAAKKKP